MKSFKILFVLLLSAFAIQSNAQTVQRTFWVAGVCEMCTERIEKAMDMSGVRAAEYDLDENKLTVAFNTKKVSEEEIHAALNAVGHDTAKSKASDEQYAGIHGCCKYRDGASCTDGKKASSCCSKDKKESSCCSKDKKEGCEKKCEDHDEEDHEH